MDVASWLRSLGLEKYEATFRNNSITEKVLPRLTAEDLKELGVSTVGVRRVFLDAIADLRSGANTAAPTSAPVAVAPKETAAERRQVTVMFSDLVGSTALSARIDPEVPSRGHFGLPKVRCRDGAGLWWLRRQVHGRWGADLFRLPPGSRG